MTVTEKLELRKGRAVVAASNHTSPLARLIDPQACFGLATWRLQHCKFTEQFAVAISVLVTGWHIHLGAPVYSGLL